MPPRPDDSKQKMLIIFLVIFVVLTITLGVTTYLGYSGQSELEKKTAEAAQKEKAKDKAQRWAEFQALALKAYAGGTLAQEEQENLLSLKGQYDQKQIGGDEKNKEGFDKLIKSFEDRNLKWSDVKKQPTQTLLGRVQELDTEILGLKDQLAKTRDAMAKTQQKYDGDLQASTEENKKLTQSLDGTKQELANTIKTKGASFEELYRKNEELSDDNIAKQKKMEAAQEETKKATEKSKEKLDALGLQNQKLKDQIAPPNVEDYDQAKGRIVSLNPRGNMAYLNLGSADNVKPQLTFSVFGAGVNGKATKDRKGAVEVVQVLDKHLSQARITDQADSGRTPVMAGDLIYNLAWSPTQRQHVTVAGIIDLTGEGHDDTQEFIRNLERQGIVIDSWLDLRDMTVKGSGMTLQTNYLVLGDIPEVGDDAALAATDRQAVRSGELVNKLTELRTDANSKGVAIVPVRRFLMQIGYRLPKVIPGSRGYSTLPGSGYSSKALPKETATEDKPEKDPSEKAAPKAKSKPKQEPAKGKKDEPKEDKEK